MCKKILFSLAIVVTGFLHAQNVIIPDVNFKAYLLNDLSINTNRDSEISVSEAAGFTGIIACDYRSINNLTGIEAFVNLSQPYCDGNNLTTLDVSKNTALIVLDCSGNQLTSLDLSKNTALKLMDCSTNKITGINVSKNTQLKMLICYDNELPSVDVSKNTLLEHLDISFNQLAGIDVSKNTVLKVLQCSANLLTGLDASKNVNLETLDISQNAFAAVDVTKNTVLEVLNCRSNMIASINLSKNLNLKTLLCYENQIKHLDVSKNTILEFLDCSTNLLHSLNVKNGNNTNFSAFNTIENPQLACIQVDDAAYSTANWHNKDAVASYNTNCNYMSANETNKTKITFYPNPVKDILRFSEEVSDVKIRDISGKIVKQISNSSKNINLENLPKGIYIITTKTKTGKANFQKLIKE